ncbi:hypothetical protein FQA39_LY10833 [Lamprigera yunnana]|nr:hypothetical protein FQA39_LY10833 [Lamprigera yunnana]
MLTRRSKDINEYKQTQVIEEETWINLNSIEQSNPKINLLRARVLRIIFKSKKSTKTKFKSGDSSESDVDVECLFCGNNYGNDHRGEGWIMYRKCGKWAHGAYPGVENDDDGAFLCEICVE